MMLMRSSSSPGEQQIKQIATAEYALIEKEACRKIWYGESIRRAESSLKCVSHILKLIVFD
jgi:hypothetical protein